MAQNWYVLHSKPHKEQIAWQLAQAQGLRVYYPRILVNPVNPRARRIRPYFPGYLFIQLDLEADDLPGIRYMPFTNGLVTFGDVPAQVPDTIVVALMRHIDAVNQAGGVALYRLQPGDPVHIKGGPFDGYQALFDLYVSGSNRARVLIKMLSDRYIPLELPVGRLEPRS